MFWGQHELYWVVFYDFCNLIGIKYKNSDREILTQWLNIGKSTGWWSPYKNICFCFERPCIVKVDKEGLLHNSDGPALGFKDGYNLFYWHGKEIPNSNIDIDLGNINTQIQTWGAFNKI